MNDISEQVVLVKTLEDKPSSVWPSFFKCVRNVIEKPVSICVTILQDRKVKKNFNFTISKFRAQRCEDNYMTSKGWKALKRKRRRTCRQGVRRIWKLYSKGRPAGKLMWCEPPRDYLDCRWQENIQRSSPQITGRAKAVTTPCLEKCVFRHTLSAGTFYNSPHRKCQKT